MICFFLFAADYKICFSTHSVGGRVPFIYFVVVWKRHVTGKKNDDKSPLQYSDVQGGAASKDGDGWNEENEMTYTNKLFGNYHMLVLLMQNEKAKRKKNRIICATGKCRYVNEYIGLVLSDMNLEYLWWCSSKCRWNGSGK